MFGNVFMHHGSHQEDGTCFSGTLDDTLTCQTHRSHKTSKQKTENEEDSNEMMRRRMAS